MHTKWYQAAASAKQRCVNPNHPHYNRYGGRGIEFKFDSISECAEYIKALPNSLDSSKTLDRIDTNRHYEKGNLRWVTQKEQCFNRRTTKLPKVTHLLELQACGYSYQDIADMYGVTVHAVNKAVSRYNKYRRSKVKRSMRRKRS